MKRTLAVILALCPVVASGAPVGPLSTYLVEPCRFLDTRTDPPAWDGSMGPLANGEERQYTTRRICGVPGDAVGLVVNVTATGATGAGHLTIWGPNDIVQREPVPSTSAVNFAVGGSAANQATVLLGGPVMPTGTDLAIRATAPGGTVHIVVDVVGFLR